MAARNRDDDDDDRPRKKRRPRDEDEDEDDRPRKKRMDEDEEEDDNDLGSSALSAIVPVGGSIFALLALWLSVLSVLLTVASAVFFWKSALSCILPIPWLFALICGALAFFTHKHKKSYGSITSNMRAVIGIVISLCVMVAHGFLIFVVATSR